MVGAGVGGLTSAMVLARRGASVTLVERDAHVGGKLRVESVSGRSIDAGPTVLTMKHVLDDVFGLVGERLDDHVKLRPLHTLARHFWPDGSRLDLHSDTDRTADAVRALAGPSEADAYRRFTRHCARLHDLVGERFMVRQRPTIVGMLAQLPTLGGRALLDLDAHRTMHEAVRSFFKDPRLVQLFDRYATYAGSNPFIAPATLNVIAAVEKAGVFTVDGGMSELAKALARVCLASGVDVRNSEHVEEFVVESGRVRGVVLASGEIIDADAVVYNGDVQGLRRGLLGSAAERSVPETKRASLSAVTIAAVVRAEGVPLERHNVFFSADYRREFDDLERGCVPASPTVYLCAQDRAPDRDVRELERILVIVNAPSASRGGANVLRGEEEQWTAETMRRLKAYGLSLEVDASVTTTPQTFAARFPGTEGALYGPASVGMWSSFTRGSTRANLKALYLAGGSVHPGAGVPMAVTSGRLAAEAVLADLRSTGRSPRTGMRGGIST